MLMAAVLTELIHSKRLEFYYRIVLCLNGLSLIAGLAFFVWTYNPIYMLIGMAFAVAVMAITIFKYTEF